MLYSFEARNDLRGAKGASREREWERDAESCVNCRATIKFRDALHCMEHCRRVGASSLFRGDSARKRPTSPIFSGSYSTDVSTDCPRNGTKRARHRANMYTVRLDPSVDGSARCTKGAREPDPTTKNCRRQQLRFDLFGLSSARRPRWMTYRSTRCPFRAHPVRVPTRE